MNIQKRKVEMDRYTGGELLDAMAALKRGDGAVWQKVAALDGSGFHVVCCFNSEQCQRIKVEQTSGRGAVSMEKMAGSAPDQMPVEIEKILEACKTNPTLKDQVDAFNRSRFDLVFVCRGRALIDWMIKDS